MHRRSLRFSTAVNKPLDVPRMQTHRWASGKLHSAAYDGVLRRLDPAAGQFELLVVREDAEFSAFDCSADGTALLLGDKDGDVEVLDARAPSAKSASLNLHDRKINTLHVRWPRPYISPALCQPAAMWLPPF